MNKDHELTSLLRIAQLREDVEDVYHLTFPDKTLLGTTFVEDELLALQATPQALGYYHITRHALPDYTPYGTGLNTVYYRWDDYTSLAVRVHVAQEVFAALKHSGTRIGIDHYLRQYVRGIGRLCHFAVIGQTAQVHETRDDAARHLERDPEADVYAVTSDGRSPRYTRLDCQDGVPHHPAYDRLLNDV